MRRLLGIVACAGLIGVTPAVSAPKGEVIDSYCSPTGDYCLAIVARHGKPKFEIATPSLRGPYEICVKNRGGKECHDFKLRRDDDGFSDRVDWARRFDRFIAGGRHRVTWYFHREKLGRALRFRVSKPGLA